MTQGSAPLAWCPRSNKASWGPGPRSPAHPWQLDSPQGPRTSERLEEASAGGPQLPAGAGDNDLLGFMGIELGPAKLKRRGPEGEPTSVPRSLILPTWVRLFLPSPPDLAATVAFFPALEESSSFSPQSLCTCCSLCLECSGSPRSKLACFLSLVGSCLKHHLLTQERWKGPLQLDTWPALLHAMTCLIFRLPGSESYPLLSNSWGKLLNLSASISSSIKWGQ